MVMPFQQTNLWPVSIGVATGRAWASARCAQRDEGEEPQRVPRDEAMLGETGGWRVVSRRISAHARGKPRIGRPGSAAGYTWGMILSFSSVEISGVYVNALIKQCPFPVPTSRPPARAQADDADEERLHAVDPLPALSPGVGGFAVSVLDGCVFARSTSKPVRVGLRWAARRLDLPFGGHI